MSTRVIILALIILFGNTLAYAVTPVSETAKGVSIPQDKGYVVEEIKDGLYWVTESTYTALFLTTGEGVIVVDAPPSFGDKMLKAISDVTKEPITHIIYSHSHADHIGGASMYPKTAKYTAHSETLRRLENGYLLSYSPL